MSRLSVFAVTLGFVCLQLGWLFAVPPARGMDEFDHVYRAVSVAAGDWYAPPSSATRGTGAEVVVRPDIIQATLDECRQLRYVSDAECRGRTGDAGVVVPSGAGRYNPLYYAAVGTPSLFLEATDAIYGMRLASMLLCALVFWACVVGVRRSGGGTWYAIGLLLAVTPTVAYSSIVVAPNALEILAGMLLWISMLELFGHPERARDPRLLFSVAVAGSLVVLLRSMGPLWCLLIVAAALLVHEMPLRRLVRLLSTRPAALTAGAVCLATMVAGTWTAAVSSWEIGHVGASELKSGPVQAIALNLVLWPLQAIAAFPYRDVPAPPLTYAGFAVVAVPFIVASLQVATGRQRAVICVVGGLFLAVPAAVTLATYDLFANAWQGRYTLPLGVGVALMAGAASLTNEPPAWLARRSVLFALGIPYVLAQTAGPVGVLTSEQEVSPGVANGNWILLPTPLVALMCALGALLMWFGVWRAGSSPTPGPALHSQPLQHGGVTPPPELTPRGRGRVGE